VLKAQDDHSPHQERAVDEPLFCARCLEHLTPGSGTFFVVSIHAVCDPAAPTVEPAPHDLRGEIERLLAQLADVSEREALDQVYRRLTLHLCVPCFRHWIEHPCGA
jgi:hypothetical protein